MNDTEELTVAEDSQSTVLFHCTGAGRPSPSMAVYKPDGETALEGEGGGDSGGGSSNTEEHLSSIAGVRCEDMGDYTCEADNGFSNPNKASVRLTVNCEYDGHRWSYSCML